MRILGFVTFVAIMLFGSVSLAGINSYPAENPRIAVSLPDNWKVENEGTQCYVYPSGENFMIRVWTIKDSVDLEGALVAINESISEKLVGLVTEEPFEMEYNGITFYSTITTGNYAESNTNMIVGTYTFNPDGNSFVVINIYATPIAWQKSEDKIMNIIKSIKLVEVQPAEEIIESVPEQD